jgi:hypothetical protein
MSVRITSIEEAPKQGIEFDLSPDSHLLVLPELNDFPESAIPKMASFLTERYFLEAGLERPSSGQNRFKDELEFRDNLAGLTGGEISYVTRAFSSYVILFSSVERIAAEIDVVDVNSGLDLPKHAKRLQSPKFKPHFGDSPESRTYDLVNGSLTTIYNRQGQSDDDPEEPDMSRLETQFTICDHVDRPLNGYIFKADIN